MKTAETLDKRPTIKVTEAERTAAQQFLRGTFPNPLVHAVRRSEPRMSAMGEEYSVQIKTLPALIERTK